MEYGVEVEQTGPFTDAAHRIFSAEPSASGGCDGAGSAVSVCGWLKVWRGIRRWWKMAPLGTEYEAAYDAVMGAVARDWPSAAPFFETLEIQVETGGIEQRLAWHDECVSTREALHEDLYFSLIEFFQRLAGRPAGDRLLQPGQIIPDIRARRRQ